MSVESIIRSEMTTVGAILRSPVSAMHDVYFDREPRMYARICHAGRTQDRPYRIQKDVTHNA